MRQYTPLAVVAGALLAVVVLGDLAVLQSGGLSGIGDAIRGVVSLIDSVVGVLEAISNALSSLADALSGGSN